MVLQTLICSAALLIQFNSMIYAVMEGDQAVLDVVFNLPADREMNVTFNTVAIGARSATGKCA